MKPKKKNTPVFNRIQELYKYLDLPADMLANQSEFAIHSLHDIHMSLPFTSPVFRSNYFSFVFIREGKGKYTTDELTFNMKAGSICFTNPGHYKSFKWYDVKNVYLITLSECFLKENVCASIFEVFPFLLAETVAPGLVNKTIFAEFEEVYLQIEREYLSDRPYRYKTIGHLFVVLLLKIKTHFWQDQQLILIDNRSSQIVKLFKRTLEKHYRDLSTGKAEKVFRAQDYADIQHLHPNYLCTVIKSKTGKAIGTWIAEKSLAEARTLLQSTTTPIKEIAYLLGFSDASHFSHFFKQHTALSPLNYRKQTALSIS